MSNLYHLAEQHVRAALLRAHADFPEFPVDSWSDPCYRGQWCVLEDAEGRRSQVELKDLIVRGVTLEPGSLATSCESLVKAVLGEIAAYAEGADLVVSRPQDGPPRDGVYSAHMEIRGIWLMLMVISDAGGSYAVLGALLGKGRAPLAAAESQVVWL